MGPGPQAEFLPVVENYSGPSPAFFDFPEIRHDLVDLPERNEVPQPFVDRKDGEGFPSRFSQVVAVEFLPFEPGALKMEVVDHDITDPRPYQTPDEFRFPHPLRQPEASWFRRQLPPHEIRCPFYLFEPVLLRNHEQDRLVESAYDKLDLSALPKLSQPLEKLRSVLLKP